MERITKEINKKFDNKYTYLKLLSASLDYSNAVCELIFLYPYTIKDISSENRLEIEKFLKAFLNLNSKLIIKYKKSFLDEELVLKEVFIFLNQTHKSITSNISLDHMSSSFEELNVNLKIRLNPEVYKYFNDNNIKEELLKFLESHFCASFSIELMIDKTIIIEDERKDIIIVPKAKVERYQVYIIKELVGEGIIDRPEYIKNIKQPKESVILSGVISNFKKGDFKPKKPKTPDEVKHFYSFTIDDGNRINVTYFSSKTAEKKMDKLVNGQRVIILGDIRKGYNDKLTLYVKKLA